MLLLDLFNAGCAFKAVGGLFTFHFMNQYICKYILSKLCPANHC